MNWCFWLGTQLHTHTKLGEWIRHPPAVEKLNGSALLVTSSALATPAASIARLILTRHSGK
ncbi:MAG: hypothetical protein KME23_25075 [Goleter apudmare HA4340-LM2]|nr:hypothetical protein [Goleter apudmare HA4340-LM2]